MTDIVQRLRNFCVWNSRHSHYDPVPVCQEAADEIERLRAATKPQSLPGCLHPGKEPLSCQYEGQCLSVSCDHHGKTVCRPRMTVLAQVDGIVYPKVES